MVISHAINDDIRPFKHSERRMHHKFVLLQKGGTCVFCALSGALLRTESYLFGIGKYHKAHVS